MVTTGRSDDILIAKLATRTPLDDDGRAAVRALSLTCRTLPAELHAAVVDGFACRHKLTSRARARSRV